MKQLCKRVQKGSTVGIICPATRVRDYNDVLKFMEMIERRGLKVKLGQSVIVHDTYLAGKDEIRAKDINDMFMDDEVDAILCYKGGFGCTRIIDKIDYKLISEHPKLFIGFSDVTALLNNINQKANVPTIHGLTGNCVVEKKCDRKSRRNYFDNIFGINEKVLKNRDDSCRIIHSGLVEAELVGGNLTLITTLLGTSYEIDMKGKILFIEDVHEEVYKIDRYLSSLRLAGKLNEVAGIICGYFTDADGDSMREKSISYLLREYFKDLNCPIIYNFQCGHDYPYITLPIGLKVRLDADNKEITILEEMFK